MIGETIKVALENCVLCRGAHSAEESYEYAKKMEEVIKLAIKKRLSEALKDIEYLEENVCQILDELD